MSDFEKLIILNAIFFIMIAIMQMIHHAEIMQLLK